MRLKSFSLNYGLNIFKSFSDESRLRILHLLHRHGRLSISDLELILEFTQSKVSRHLIYLKNKGIVNSQQVDQWTFYSIKEEVEDILTQIFEFIQKDQLLLKDSKTYSTLSSNRELAENKINMRRML